MDNQQKAFFCDNCKHEIKYQAIGTKNRNHCPHCLCSKHVDQIIDGDRKATCHSIMKPIGLTFKQEGKNKYGKQKQGEIMLVHQCQKCQKISINRIAGDDEPLEILKIFESSQKEFVINNNIKLATQEDKEIILKQLFGLNFNKWV